MRDLFLNPPREYRMLQIVHGLGRYQRELPGGVAGLAELLDERGYGGVVTNVDFSDRYLESEEDWRLFVKGVEALRARDLVVWLYDEKGYPSLKAGGIILRDHPEYEAIGLACVRTEGEGTIIHSLPADEETDPEPLCAVALPVDAEGRHDLAGAIAVEATGAGTVTWEAPGGRWAVFTFHRHVAYQGTHCVTNYSDKLRYPNIIDREATAHFIQVTHEAYRARLGDRLRQDVAAIFTDEPSLMTVYLAEADTALPVVPWSRSFPDDFAAQRGCDVFPLLPALFVDCGEAGRYARVAFWQTVAELVERNFYGQIEDWCREQGVGSSGHALWEEHLYWQVGFEGDLYRALRRMDVPGIDILSSDPKALSQSNAIPIPKFVSSVMHLSGRRQCMSETSSHAQRMSGQPVSLAQRVGTVNWQYALGLNLVTSYYGLDEMPPEEMKRFNDHLGRLGALLTDGRHVADIAVFYPVQAAWAGYVPTAKALQPPGEEIAHTHQVFADTCNVLLRHQRDYDIVDDEAVRQAEVAGGALRVQDEVFRCLVVPAARVMPLEAFRKIGQFAAAGGRVVFIEPVPAYGTSSAETSAIGGMWPGLLDAGRVQRLPDAGHLPTVLAGLVEPDVTLDQPAPLVHYVHRVKEGRHLYFVTNCDDQPVERAVTFRCEGTPEVWHPTTTDIVPAEVRSVGEGTVTVRLRLAAFEGVFVVF